MLFNVKKKKLKKIKKKIIEESVLEKLSAYKKVSIYDYKKIISNFLLLE